MKNKFIVVNEESTDVENFTSLSQAQRVAVQHTIDDGEVYYVAEIKFFYSPSLEAIEAKL